jgi:hypothetical protein
MVRGGVLCKQHRREMAAALQSLRLGMYELAGLARREFKLAGRGQGHASAAFASTPLNMSAQVLYDETDGMLQDMAAAIGLWGVRCPVLIRRLQGRLVALASSPHCGEAFKEITHASEKIRLWLTPPDERIIYGRCLNPVCLHEVSGVTGQKEATCEYCGSTWSVSAIRASRRERYRLSPVDVSGVDRTLRMTPAQAAAWLRGQTNVRVSRKSVTNWLGRGLLPSAVHTDEKGVWRFNPIELLDCIENGKDVAGAALNDAVCIDGHAK